MLFLPKEGGKMRKVRKDTKGRILKKGEYQRKGGGYCFAYTDALKKRHYIYDNDLLSLREKEKKININILLEINPSDHTIDTVFHNFILLNRRIKPSTREYYLEIYRCFIKEALGNVKISSIKRSDYKFFLLKLLDKGYKYNTVESVDSILHSVFKVAVQDDLIMKNPATGVLTEIKPSFNEERIDKYLSVEQQKALLEYLREEPKYNKVIYPLILLMLGTGSRIGEALALRWDDIDFDNNIIAIHHTIKYYGSYSTGEKSSLHYQSPKTTKSKRMIPMLDEVRNALMDLNDYQNKNQLKSKKVDKIANFIFFKKNGVVYHPGNIDFILKAVAKDYNEKLNNTDMDPEEKEKLMMPNITCHWFRHTFCVRFCEQESNVKVIQTVMGHANISTTMNIYAAITEKKIKESMNEFQKLAKNMNVFNNEK